MHGAGEIVKEYVACAALVQATIVNPGVQMEKTGNFRTLVFIVATALVAAACSRDPSPAPPSSTPIPPSAASSLPLSPTPAPAPPPTATPSSSPTPVVPTPTPTFVPEPVILPTVAVPLSMDRRAQTDPLSEVLDSLGDRASLVRSLFSRQIIERQFITRQQLSQRLLEDFEEDREEVLKFEELYEALGILDPDESLFDVFLAMYSEGVLGFFDSEEEKIYLVREGSELGAQDQLTYVHEYVHGLQQQHYDINTTFNDLEENFDRSLAFRGLIEGDASVSEVLYMLRHMNEEEQAEARSTSGDSAFDAFRAAAHVIQRIFTFPYVEGFQFVAALFTAINDWDLVDEAFAALPQSTEQVLHPDKYTSGEAPVMVDLPDVSATLGEGWSERLTDTFGEFFIRAYLEMSVPTERASLASTGWGGDRFILLKSDDDETLLYALISWDAEHDAREFYEAFLEFNEERTGNQWEQPAEDGDTQRLMNLDGQVVFLGWMGSDTLLIFAPDNEVLEAARSAARGV